MLLYCYLNTICCVKMSLFFMSFHRKLQPYVKIKFVSKTLYTITGQLHKYIFAYITSFWLFSGGCTGRQIQDNVDSSSNVNIRVGMMIENCAKLPGRVPTIQTFVFNFWGTQCYNTSSYDLYPQLFNRILQKMNTCTRRPTGCSTLSYTLPTVQCTGKSVPNTFAINYSCARSFQLPIVLPETTHRSTHPSSTAERATSRSTSRSSSVTTRRTTRRTQPTTGKTMVEPSITTTLPDIYPPTLQPITTPPTHTPATVT